MATRPAVPAVPEVRLETHIELPRAPAQAVVYSLPDLNFASLEDEIHAAAWKVGRAFSFQAFNRSTPVKPAQPAQPQPAQPPQAPQPPPGAPPAPVLHDVLPAVPQEPSGEAAELAAEPNALAEPADTAVEHANGAATGSSTGSLSYHAAGSSTGSSATSLTGPSAEHIPGHPAGPSAEHVPESSAQHTAASSAVSDAGHAAGSSAKHAAARAAASSSGHASEISAQPAAAGTSAKHAAAAEPSVEPTITLPTLSTPIAPAVEPAQAAAFEAGKWIPATIFVAGDHLCSLLLYDVLARLPALSTPAAKGETAEDEAARLRLDMDPRRRFSRAVWELHTQIFYNYYKWCKQVHVHPRIANPHNVGDPANPGASRCIATGAAAVTTCLLAQVDPFDPYLCNDLLAELALFFLVHTEGANLRHASETIWFLFWTHNTSPIMAHLWTARPPAPDDQRPVRPAAALHNGRERRVQLRNTYQEEIATPMPITTEVTGTRVVEHQHSPMVPCYNLAALPVISSKLHLGFPHVSDASAPDALAPDAEWASDLGLVSELATYGDGGMFMDRIVGPVFALLAHEMDFMTGEGEEVPHRLGYDDLNESCCDRVQVGQALKNLTTKPELCWQDGYNDTYAALLLIGCPNKSARDRGLLMPGDSLELAEKQALYPTPVSLPTAANGRAEPITRMLVFADAKFEEAIAASFWSRFLAVKTFRERRTVLAVYRAFYRVYCLHIVGFHLLLCQAFDPWNRNLLSTAILSHALCQAIERFANWWIGRNTTSPLATTAAEMKERGDAEACDGRNALAAGPKRGAALTCVPRAVRTQRPPVVAGIEGSPWWGWGHLEWWALFLVLVVLFVFQYHGPFASQRHKFRRTWRLLTWCYPGAILVHYAATNRNGYCFSLTSRLWWIFRASSARPRAERWLEGTMRVAWSQTLMNAAMWLLIFALKFSFDFYALRKTLVEPIRDILTTSWLTCVDPSATVIAPQWHYTCFGGAFVLVVARIAPFFVLSLLDTAFFYSAVVTLFGMWRGYWSDLGLVSTLTELADTMHDSPDQFWNKCMSTTGQTNMVYKIKHPTAAPASPDNAGSTSASPVRAPANELDTGTVNGIHSMSSRPRSPRVARTSGTGGSRASPPALSNESSSTELPLPPRNTLPLPLVLPADSSSNTVPGGAQTTDTSVIAQERAATSTADERAAQARTATEMMVTRVTERAKWEAFASAWSSVVADLRDMDLISNKERDNLQFLLLDIPLDPHRLTNYDVRAVLLPTFFYAGKLQGVIESGVCKEPQAEALEELRRLAIALLSGMGMLDQQQAQALAKLRFHAMHESLQHQESRLDALKAGSALVKALQDGVVKGKSPDVHQLRRAAENVGKVLDALAEECESVKHRSLAELYLNDQHAANELAEVVKQLRKKFVNGKDFVDGPSVVDRVKQGCNVVVTSCINFCDGNQEGVQPEWESDAEAVAKCRATAYEELNKRMECLLPTATAQLNGNGEPPTACPKLLATMLKGLASMMSDDPTAAAVASQEARRVLCFFINSLGSTSMPLAPSVADMRSLTVLTPLYNEDVLYPLKAAKETDLLSDNVKEGEEGMSLMAFLKSIFPGDFANFMERIKDMAVEAKDILKADEQLTEQDFNSTAAKKGKLARFSLDLRLWASNRGQLLARTVKGMTCYGRAFKVLARLEHPRLDLDEVEYNKWIDKLVSQKFKHLVAAQTYGPCAKKLMKDPTSKEALLADAVNELMLRYPLLRVAYLDTENEIGSANFSVLICGGELSHVDTQTRDGTTPLEAAKPFQPTELYRVRLPTNHFTINGVKIGEGKPENQNNAVIFAFGEGLQAIDMNQDNYLSEALKMRNLLATLDPEPIPPETLGRLFKYVLSKFRGVKNPYATKKTDGKRFGEQTMEVLRSKKAGEQATVLVGFREWVFSDKVGALGSYAASAEFAFGTIFQRIMSWPGGVRMHYGHPDVFNKMETMTQGGMSRATRTIHVSEDVFGGYNHTLRGSGIKYEEFISCGKGRDMGFDSINLFEAKVSGGGGEILISREMFRLCPRMEFFRLCHLYFSGSGYFINNLLLFMTSYLLIYSILLLVLANANDILVLSQVKGELVFNAKDAVDVTYALQIGLVTNLPYMGQMMLEVGVGKTLVILLMQIASGSIMFFVFRQYTSGYNFLQDLMYGGAKYISTGRGFNLTPSPFVLVYSMYARTHLYFALEILLWCIVLAISLDYSRCVGLCNYPGLTWGTYLIGVSLLVAPFWFNPLSFSLESLQQDSKGFSVWLNGGYVECVKGSWLSWNRAQNEKIRNVKLRQTDRWLTTASFIVGGCIFPALLAIATVSRLEVKHEFPFSALHSKWILFGILTVGFWLVVFAAAKVSRAMQVVLPRKGWRFLRWVVLLFALSLPTAYLFASTYWLFRGRTIGTLAIMVYANFNIYLVIQRFLMHLWPEKGWAVAFVDAGLWSFDFMAGYFLLGFVALMSILGVGYLQMRLLFSDHFVRYLAEGKVLRLLGPRWQDAAALDVEVRVHSSAADTAFHAKVDARIEAAWRRHTTGGGAPPGSPQAVPAPTEQLAPALESDSAPVTRRHAAVDPGSGSGGLGGAPSARLSAAPAQLDAHVMHGHVVGHEHTL